MSDRSGEPEIWTMAPDGSDQRAISFGPGTDAQAWRQNLVDLLSEAAREINGAGSWVTPTEAMAFMAACCDGTSGSSSLASR